MGGRCRNLVNWVWEIKGEGGKEKMLRRGLEWEVGNGVGMRIRIMGVIRRIGLRLEKERVGEEW